RLATDTTCDGLLMEPNAANSPMYNKPQPRAPVPPVTPIVDAPPRYAAVWYTLPRVRGGAGGAASGVGIDGLGVGCLVASAIGCAAGAAFAWGAGLVGTLFSAASALTDCFAHSWDAICLTGLTFVAMITATTYAGGPVIGNVVSGAIGTMWMLN